MANENCGCNGNSSAPPGTTFPTVSSPVGSISSYGGSTIVPRSPCRPAQCPSPPVSEAPERSPVCFSWLDQLTTKAAGMLLLVLEGCIYKLKSKCSGFIYYDATTEQASVQDPKFVSSIPKEATYGFLAKVVPTARTVCVDGQDSCEQEVRQELASQIMGDISCGRLVVANPPLCGDVPVAQSADIEKQVRMDYLDPPLHEDLGCPVGVRFLVMTPGKRGPSGRQLDCQQWSLMRRLTLRGSDLGALPAGDPLEGTGYVPIFIPVAGGSSDDPCFEMRLSSQKLSQGLPVDGNNCDIPVFRFAGTEEAGWYTEEKGLSFHPVTYATLFSSTNVGSLASFQLELPDYPSNPCGEVYAQLEIVQSAGLGPSGSGTSLIVRHLDSQQIMGYCGNGNNNMVFHPMCPADSDGTLTLSRTKSGTGVSALYIRLTGYWY